LRPITGVPYLACERGPAPENYDELFGTLVQGGLLHREELPTRYDTHKIQFRPTRTAKQSIFEASELAVLDEVVDNHAHRPTDDLIEGHHAWREPWFFVHDTSNRKKHCIPWGVVRWQDNQPDEDYDGTALEAARKSLADPDVEAALLGLE